IEDKVLDLFDDECDEEESETPYSNLKARILDEHKISTQDKIEKLFQLIEASGRFSVNEIVSRAKDYLSNILDVREEIIKQILVRSLP
ncbi:Hypothetical protein FKW44_019525, partial [Caligus rogercresseyi]